MFGFFSSFFILCRIPIFDVELVVSQSFWEWSTSNLLNLRLRPGETVHGQELELYGQRPWIETNTTDKKVNEMIFNDILLFLPINT